jgi:hypothetical protein
MECSREEFEKRMVDVREAGYPILNGREVLAMAAVEWRRACFVTHDAVGLVNGGYTSIAFREKVEEDEWIIEDGWNHEHCGVCRFTFSGEGHGDECAGGWTDERGFHWLCDDCLHCLRAWLERNPIPRKWLSRSK